MKKNSRGFTLVEVIASIAILGIVVVSLLPLFPQILGWTKTTEDQLIAGNLLSQVVYDLKDDNLKRVDLDSLKYEYTINKVVYKPEITFTQNDTEIELNLIQAKITILDKNTYVYLKDSGAKNE